MCIRYHMGAYTDKKEWSYYGNAVRECSGVLLTHMADMLASHVDDMQGVWQVTDADIKKVVNATIDSMLRKNMLRYNDNVILSSVGNILTRYYDSDMKDITIKDTLDKLSDHTYSDILAMYYRDHMTLEVIAEKYNVDVSTIRRNKRKLCLEFYNKYPDMIELG